MGMEFGTAFRAGRAISHGWWAFKQQWMLLFLGAFLAHCGEGGGGGGGGNSFSSDGSSDWDPDGWGGGGSDWDPEGALGAMSSAWAGTVELGAGLGVPALPLAIGGIGGVELAIIAIILLVVFVFVGVLWLFKCWWVPGYMRLQADTLQQGSDAPNRLFSGGDTFISFALLTLLEGFIILGVMGVAAVPLAVFLAPGLYLENTALAVVGGALGGLIFLGALIYVGLGIALSKHALVLDGCTPVEALGQSWSLMSGNRFDLFLFNIVMGLYTLGMVIAGLFMCLIGVFFTSTIADAVTDLGLTESYLLLTRPDEDTDAYRVWEADLA